MEARKCKHCNENLSKVAISPDSDWGVEYLMICMNDDCGYYSRGWDWMKKNYNVKASYRYFYNEIHGTEGPIPITSPMDLKNSIIKQL